MASMASFTSFCPPGTFDKLLIMGCASGGKAGDGGCWSPMVVRVPHARDPPGPFLWRTPGPLCRRTFPRRNDRAALSMPTLHSPRGISPCPLPPSFARTPLRRKSEALAR